MKSNTLITSLIVTLAASVGCVKKTDDNADDRVEVGKTAEQPDQPAEPSIEPIPEREPDIQDTEPATADTVDGEVRTDEERSEFVTRARKTLDTLDRKAAEARAEIERAGDNASDETRENLEELERKRKRLAAELDDASDRSADQWDEFKRDVGQMADDLEASYNRMLEGLKTDDKD
jgi:hypothetical protein